MYDLPRIDEFFEGSVDFDLRGHRFKLRHQLSQLIRRKLVFLIQMIELQEVDFDTILKSCLPVFGQLKMLPNSYQT